MITRKKTSSNMLVSALVLIAGALSAGSGAEKAAAASDTTRPAPKPAEKGAYETGVYRNMFVEYGLDKDLVQSNIEKAYQQLFHGNPETESVLYFTDSNENGPMANIKDIGNSDIRSEGMSYGMMIAVQLNKKRDFDALWNWARTYMYQTNEKHPDYGYFAWQIKPDGTKLDDNPAPDGEEYFAMALYFAAHRWGSGKGIYNYKAAADKIVSDMVHRKDIYGPINNGIDTTTITSLMNREAFMVRFTPYAGRSGKNIGFTDPSYHVPAFYELFALWGPEQDRKFWQKCAQASRDFFVKVTNPETGLSPDFAGFDGKPVEAPWNRHSKDFGHDAFRTAMNWSMDAAWWAKDLKRQVALSDRIQTFFEREGIGRYKATHTLDGKPTCDYSASGLGAMNAVAGLCASHERAWKFIAALWNTPLPTGKWRYYDGMLYMFAMLNLSGNYKIYKPAK
jgi:oligosaccharide reducing-end xylanase